MDHKENAERQVSVDHPALKALMGLPVMLAQLDQLASKETRELRSVLDYFSECWLLGSM